jgi:cAMP-dependent protein kinase regulator
VSAEVEDLDDDFEPPVHEKEDATKDRLFKAVSKNILFNHLDEDQREVVVDAMFRVEKAEGETIIKQGDDGDNFYIIESGQCDVFVKKGDKPAVKVITVGPGNSFGELALMYNCPRAATVTAQTDTVLWAVDRKTFTCIVVRMSVHAFGLQRITCIPRLLA